MTRLLFFGPLSDIAGYTERELDLPPDVATVADLRTHLSAHHCLLGEALAARGVRIAVNQVMCTSDAASARDAVEIAFMSPLSGG